MARKTFTLACRNQKTPVQRRAGTGAQPSIGGLQPIQFDKHIMSNFAKTLIAAAAIAALLGALAACSPLTLINTLSPNSAATVTRDIAYGADARHKLDIYAPATESGPGPGPGPGPGSATAAPVVVFFYGGNWNSGQRADYAFVGHALASRGIVAVIADYRLHPQVRYPAFLQDSAQAVAWTINEVAHYGGDARRVYLMGHSAGAYNAAMLALAPQWLAGQGQSTQSVRGWIGLAGPYNFIPIENPTARLVFPYPATPPDSQPINHVSAASPPALLIAARSDDLVDPQRNTGALADKLRALGVPVTERHFDHVSHATLVASLAGPLRTLAPTLEAIAQFIERDGARPLPPMKEALP
jgi:acetyl esterase/lipase